ncbi:hypothetical protein P175DRAFT_0463492 [Aspergillus ochraceoroseus IBT 24754]|uniref:DUF2423 domain-containing protein n=3 Tax=Aspergillus subgen. Nidulantes TaxID=2720870 RepID=A0A0F8X601_9EURO|nr:uncharacterized protein P175DRAFT_0463492 [Aspergillus ochraceoroseus IBT 24754]KKK25070.1 hypothetical protein ARAM_003136 [Aspergillus rambellii]KKK26028.1 hypothetical protein AOCH_000495 [Aspergillus ochraceoroseus]PTU18675.1 hypothetical protein P175DRAFT_0463492 [Aspergillus ochraceoroseus IBT 24754]
MAKSVRASVSKRNKAKLRATVFGPVVDARTERLSAKLQELAAQPKPSDQEKSKMSMDVTESDAQNSSAKTNPAESGDDMDVDNGTLKNNAGRSQRSGRIQKRRGKSRSSIVFRPHPSKTKKFSKKK